MGLSKNLAAYSDVRAVLDPAMEAGTARYTLSSPAQAIRWRARAYQFRKLVQDQLAAANRVPGYIPQTIYDHMLLRLDGRTVIIDAVQQPTGELVLATGVKVQPKVEMARPLEHRQPNTEAAPPPEEDLLNEAALALLKSVEDGKGEG